MKHLALLIVLSACTTVRVQPAPTFNAFCYSEGPPCAAVIASAQRARRCLARHGPWKDAALAGALRGVAIYVQSTPTWFGLGGAQVAGEAWPPHKTVTVGSDLVALAHELAELAYTELEEGHPWTWHSRPWPGRAGVQQAVEAYTAGSDCGH